jgi:hypothetical protein
MPLWVIASARRVRGNPEGCEDEVRGNLSLKRDRHSEFTLSLSKGSR